MSDNWFVHKNPTLLFAIITSFFFLGCASRHDDTSYDSGTGTDSGSQQGVVIEPDSGVDQELDIVEISRCALTPMEYFTETVIEPPEANKGGYQVPSQEMMDSMGLALSLFLQGQVEEAIAMAGDAGYVVCEGSQGQDRVVVWHPQMPGTGHASWVIRLSDRVGQLIVEAPHGFYDVDTIVESVEIFEKVRARSLLVTGTNRCALCCGLESRSECDGSSGSCNSFFYYKSDMSHVAESMFQVAHRVLSDHFFVD